MVQVRVHMQEMSDGRVVYKYRVINPDCPVGSLNVGQITFSSGELFTLPLGFRESPSGNYYIPQANVHSPMGWSANFEVGEEGGGHMTWEIKRSSAPMTAGTSLSGFEVVTPHSDNGYYLGHWILICTSGQQSEITGQLSRE